MRSLNVSCLVGQGKTKYIRFSGISIAAWIVVFIDQAKTNKWATNVATQIQHFLNISWLCVDVCVFINVCWWNANISHKHTSVKSSVFSQHAQTNKQQTEPDISGQRAGCPHVQMSNYIPEKKEHKEKHLCHSLCPPPPLPLSSLIPPVI